MLVFGLAVEFTLGLWGYDRGLPYATLPAWLYKRARTKHTEGT